MVKIAAMPLLSLSNPTRAEIGASSEKGVQMDLFAQVDAYCERTDFSFWSEPVNALTNIGYILVALWFLRAMRGVPLGQVMGAILLAIGIGSFLFHTLATGWAGLADTLPIAVFILVYLYAVNRHALGWPVWAAGLGVLAYFPYAAGVVWIADFLPFFRTSNFYWSVPILLFLYAALFRQQLGGLALGFLAGGAVLSLSISVRSVDLAVCDSFPLGTHFLWHVFNAAMFVIVLGSYRAHMLAAHGRRR